MLIIKFLKQSLIFSILFTSSTFAQGKLAKTPDGVLHKPSGFIFAHYASLTTGGTVAVTDHKDLGAGIKYPLFTRLTLSVSYFVENRDSLYHNYRALATVYLVGPSKKPKCNPDGPIGGPVVIAGWGGEIPDQFPKNHRYQGLLELLYPFNTHWSFGLGGNYYQPRVGRQDDKVFGVINFFPRAYLTGEEYSNPDGVEGIPSLSLSGGGSRDGIFGQVDLIIPLTQKTTVVFYGRGERYPKPYLRSALIGCRVNFYPEGQKAAY